MAFQLFIFCKSISSLMVFDIHLVIPSILNKWLQRVSNIPSIEVLSTFFINFTRFINLSISPSLKIQILFSSLSHSIFEKKNKKNQIMSFFESLGDSVGEAFVDASPWNFVSNKAHQGALLLVLLFNFLFIYLYVLLLEFSIY